MAAKIENWKMKPAKRTDNFSFIRLSWISSQTWIIIMEVTSASEEHNRNLANWLAPGRIGRFNVTSNNNIRNIEEKYLQHKK